MTFEIPKDMKFEEISPRKGKGAASTYRETVRCGLTSGIKQTLDSIRS